MSDSLSQWIAPLLNLGTGGVVLAWMMFRFERRVEGVERALNAHARAMLIEVLTRRDVPPNVALEVRELLDDLGGQKGGKN